MDNRYHFIGIGGIGMSALAAIALERGAIVSGSDQKMSPIIDKLRAQGAVISIGHAVENVPEGAVIVYSSGIHKDNPELAYASSTHSRLLHRSTLLNEFAKDKHFIGVVGTHGKTTTTALLIHIYEALHKQPSFALGGVIKDLEANGRWTGADMFIAELDESDGSFLNSTPHAVCLTNVDSDHLDYYGDTAALRQAFEKFVAKVRCQDQIVWCGDSIGLRKLRPKGCSFGFGSDCTVRATHFEQCGPSLQMDIDCDGKKILNVQVPLMGTHNALNVLAAFGQCYVQGLDLEKVKESLKTFTGVKRRSETLLQNQENLVFNDYAHHPTEVSATLHALRAAYPDKRIVAVFQPHRTTRVSRCMGMWDSCFEAADKVYVVDIFSLENKCNVHAKDIVEECLENDQNYVAYSPTASIVATLLQERREGDLFLFMGAGDITQYAKQYCDVLNEKTHALV